MTANSPLAMTPSNVRGLLVVVGGITAALLAPLLIPAVGPLTWGVLLGSVVANIGLLPVAATSWVGSITKRLLRVGVVLLGFSLSLTDVGQLGAPMLLLIVAALATTLLLTTWLGQRLGLTRSRSLLIATGFSICGASAVAAMEETAEADEEDVAVAIAMVTLCGTAAMLILPLLREPLGLTAEQYGAWAGASVHEVGQVVAAAGPAGTAAVAVAVVVKLTRVLLLAPVVAGVNLWQRHHSTTLGPDSSARQPPLVPLFVLGFLGCVVLRSTGTVPPDLIHGAHLLQTLTLTAALFGMGTAVRLRELVRSSGRALTLSICSTLMIGTITLAGVLYVV